MNMIFCASALVVFAAVSLGIINQCAAAPPEVGAWASYRLRRKDDLRPDITTVRLAVVGKEVVNEKTLHWFEMRVNGSEGERFTVRLLIENLDFLRTESTSLNVSRYVFHEVGQRPLEYVNAHTGEALLPSLDFVKNFLPHAAKDAQWENAFFSKGTYLGHPLDRVGTGRDAADVKQIEATKLSLAPELLIGTARAFHDTECERLYTPGEPPPEGNPDYHYTEFTKEDYDELIDDVGMNLFTLYPYQLPFVQDKPVFFVLRDFSKAKYPEMFYRSNFKGAVQFMDEPAYLCLRDNAFEESKTPAEAADRLVAIVRERRMGVGAYGSRYIQESLKRLGYDLGSSEIVERDYPVWEVTYSAAWYELKAGISGLVYEGRYQPAAYADEMKETFGVEVPPNADACLRIHDAFFKGAARHFKADWGTSVYGQMEPSVAPVALTRAYDAGARYLWFWTSDHAHHLPYPEQKSLTRYVRSHEAAHPRERPISKLHSKANVAIVLPYGYHLDDYVIRWQSLWRNERFGLDKDNGHGATYRAVLSAAVKNMIECINAKLDFDVAYDDENFSPSVYQEVRRVRENGQVEIERK